MEKYTPQQMAAYLSRCAAGICNDECPWVEVPTNCEEAMMRHAAEILDPEEVDGDD